MYQALAASDYPNTAAAVAQLYGTLEEQFSYGLDRPDHDSCGASLLARGRAFRGRASDIYRTKEADSNSGFRRQMVRVDTVLILEQIRMNDVEHQPAEAGPTSPIPAQRERFAGLPVSGGRHGPGRHLSSAGFDAPAAYGARAASFVSAAGASALSWR
jgi:hypothetical protein